MYRVSNPVNILWAWRLGHYRTPVLTLTPPWWPRNPYLFNVPESLVVNTVPRKHTLIGKVGCCVTLRLSPRYPIPVSTIPPWSSGTNSWNQGIEIQRSTFHYYWAYYLGVTAC